MNGAPDDEKRRADGRHPALPLGAFAARSRLSPKALRLYDRLGLLSPARVDETSGERYYDADQVEHARLVALLRRLDMPLPRVAEVTGLGAASAARGLGEFWAEVEARITAQRALVEYLRARLSGQSTRLYEQFHVRVVDVAPQYVITQSRHALAHELPAWVRGSLDRLVGAAETACGGVADAPFVVFHAEVTQESDGPVETCVPVGDPAAARAWVLAQGRSGAVGVRQEPARRLACTTITKAQVEYPQIIGAYEAVEEWIARQGLRVAGPGREVYFAAEEWDAAGPDEAMCDVAYPVVA
ncbi:MerR family transcriptional regulator [Streptomyces sp. NPDC050560]|uniref:MerR family transcriptional regulator n=1 Tax=Streptomyces sp. NPDC050560 TaxID=3365630 RepID=UPI0037B11931